MKLDEAIEWLTGKRSMTNLIPKEPYETHEVRIAQADAAMMHQAFLIVQASEQLDTIKWMNVEP